MSERAYTVAEIDALRRACGDRWLWGTTMPTGIGVSRSFRAEEKDKGTEELIRTYMLAGITAADIYAEDRERAKHWQEAMKPKPLTDAELSSRREKLASDLSTLHPASWGG